MDVKGRGLGAAVAYLERVGMTTVVVGENAPSGADILSVDGDTLVATIVRIGRGRQIAPDISDRRARNALRALRVYRTENDLPLGGLRVDSISLLVIAEDRALLRHHRGLLADQC